MRVCVCVDIYYMYIHRERESEKERERCMWKGTQTLQGTHGWLLGCLAP